MANLLDLLNDYKEHKANKACVFCGAVLKHNNASRAYNDYCMTKNHFFKYDKRNNNLSVYFMERDEGLWIRIKPNDICVWSSYCSLQSNSGYLTTVPLDAVEGYINELLDNYKLLE